MTFLLFACATETPGVVDEDDTGQVQPPVEFSDQLADADQIFLGETKTGSGFNPADWFGWRVVGVGDVDGDERADLLMTGRFDDEGEDDAGKVYLVTAAELDALSSPTSVGVAGSQWYGEGVDEHAGRDLARAGDLDGDGLDDLFISSYSSLSGFEAGATFVVLASSIEPGRSALADADYVLYGSVETEHAGRAIDGGDDLDGDGVDDLVVGAMGWDRARGRVHQLSGASLQSGELSEVASATMEGEGDYENLGVDVAAVGDVDGDGVGDVLVGAWTYTASSSAEGKAYLSLGGVLDGAAADADHRWIGVQQDGSFGRAVAGAGDVDGDGLDDFLVGGHGPLQSDASDGYTTLFLAAGLGPPGEGEATDADIVFEGAEADDYSGDALAGAGDVDGDGLDDIVLGALFTGDEGGTAYLWYGASLEAGVYSLGEADQLFHSETDLDRAGASVAGVGDVDGNGRSDLLIGAYGFDEERGAAYLLLAP